MLRATGLAILLLLAIASSASAHAVLLSSTPAWEAVVGAAPRAVTLRYDEDVVPRSWVTVVAPGGKDVAGSPQVTGSAVTVPVRTDRAGSYTVRWRMVASDDGHVTDGAFSFGLRAKPLPPAPVSR